MSKALLKVFRGNKITEEHYPIAVVLGDTGERNHRFSEHYIFSGFPKKPFIFRRTGIECDDPKIWAHFSDAFSAESLLQQELNVASAHFEHAIFELDRTLHRVFFLEGRRFEFLETDQQVLIQLKIRDLYKEEFSKMFDFSQSVEIQTLAEQFAKLNSIRARFEPDEAR